MKNVYRLRLQVSNHQSTNRVKGEIGGIGSGEASPQVTADECNDPSWRGTVVLLARSNNTVQVGFYYWGGEGIYSISLFIFLPLYHVSFFVCIPLLVRASPPLVLYLSAANCCC